MKSATYVGRELELFAQARNWKRYWASQVSAYIAGDVLEVGAGIGANTLTMRNQTASSWTCLEPDAELAAKIPRSDSVHAIVGTLASMNQEPRFDALVYIDVLEHIEDDREELARAATMLRPGGHLIVLAPAHQSLYSPFDEAIGHFRRYNRKSLLACQPPSSKLVRMIYLDSAGLIASFLNRMVLRQSTPALMQIQTWDRLLVPVSKVVDPLLFYRWGKSILAVWTKI